MRTLAFLDPGHFHAALTLGERHPQVRDDLVVHAPKGPELDDFLGLVDSGRASAANYDPQTRARWHGMFVSIAQQSGYKSGWVAHKFKEKFGTSPAKLRWGNEPGRTCAMYSSGMIS